MCASFYRPKGEMLRRRVTVVPDEVVEFKAFVEQDASVACTAYALKAVIVHSGSAQSGHYFIFILHGGQW
jgi:uncharacterized UBP type Zn finger protein